MEARLEHLSATERRTLTAALPVLARLSRPEA
jgi:hypothetical protein